MRNSYYFCNVTSQLQFSAAKWPSPLSPVQLTACTCFWWYSKNSAVAETKPQIRSWRRKKKKKKREREFFIGARESNFVWTEPLARCVDNQDWYRNEKVTCRNSVGGARIGNDDGKEAQNQWKEGSKWRGKRVWASVDAIEYPKARCRVLRLAVDLVEISLFLWTRAWLQRVASIPAFLAHSLATT